MLEVSPLSISDVLLIRPATVRDSLLLRPGDATCRLFTSRLTTFSMVKSLHHIAKTTVPLRLAFTVALSSKAKRPYWRPILKH